MGCLPPPGGYRNHCPSGYLGTDHATAGRSGPRRPGGGRRDAADDSAERRPGRTAAAAAAKAGGGHGRPTPGATWFLGRRGEVAGDVKRKNFWRGFLYHTHIIYIYIYINI